MPSAIANLYHFSARLLFKRFVNSNYDPVVVREKFRKRDKPSFQGPLHRIGMCDVEVRGNGAAPLLVYVPGGGFCFGPSDANREFLDDIAKQTGRTGWLVHHRLAPEAPFPAALEDVERVLHEALETTSDTVVMGDSSGGALVLGALQHRRRSGAPMPQCGVLLSPATDLALTGISVVANSRRDPIGGPEALAHKAYHYLQGASPTNPDASPFWGEAAGFPPLLFIVGKDEVLLDDTVRMAAKISAAKGSVVVREVEGMSHVFPILRFLPEARTARAEVTRFMTENSYGASRSAARP